MHACRSTLEDPTVAFAQRHLAREHLASLVVKTRHDLGLPPIIPRTPKGKIAPASTDTILRPLRAVR